MTACGFLVELELILTDRRVWSLFNQLLLQFSMAYFETMHIYCGYI